MSKVRRQGQPAPDLEEIRPNRFIIHEPRLAGLLRGEGTIEGRSFELTTWRRDGLLGRLRQRGFQIATLADQIEALPTPPPAPPLQGPCWRALTTPIERFSVFDPQTLAWLPLPPETRDGAQVVVARAGQVLRRRKGRGAPAFYLGLAERGGTLGLSPLDETEALLAGYAQAADQPSLRLEAVRAGQDDLWRLPEVELPPPHRSLLRRLLQERGGANTVGRSGLALAQELFARLGVRLGVGG